MSMSRSVVAEGKVAAAYRLRPAQQVAVAAVGEVVRVLKKYSKRVTSPALSP
jgi:hypothetical protein